MIESPHGVEDCPGQFFFGENVVGRRDLVGALAERGAVLGLVTFILICTGTYGLYMMWNQPATGASAAPVLFGLILLWSLWHYFGMVVEIRITSSDLSYRRFVRFRSIPWEKISSVSVYSLKTTGISYVATNGRSVMPLALFPLWIPVYRPDRWSELVRMIEQTSRRVQVKHRS